jgi:rare lipoprotein A (peptidoglycan hydrolase)
VITALLAVAVGAPWFPSALHLERAPKPKPPPPPMQRAVASWYDDRGTTASGWHAAYGVANLTLAFGTRVLFAYHGRRVTATVDDRGPYVAGRMWDLAQSTAGALGFSGVDVVSYRVLR